MSMGANKLVANKLIATNCCYQFVGNILLDI